MTSPASTSPLAELELVRQVGQTTVGTLWTGRLDDAASAAEVLDLAAAQRAGLDPGLLEVLPTLAHPGLAPPTAITTSPCGPALVLAAAIGRPLVLPGPAGELATLLPVATRLVAGLAALHDAGLTHNAITVSLLCPGPDGQPQLAVTAAAAAPGDRHSDVHELLTALAALDPAAAAQLTDHMSEQNLTGPEPARALLEQLRHLAAQRPASATTRQAPALPGTVPTVPAPDALAAHTCLPADGGHTIPDGPAPSRAGLRTRPGARSVHRSPRLVSPGPEHGRQGPLRQLLAGHPILLGGGAALVVLLVGADIALAAGGHHRATTAGSPAAPAQPTPPVTEARPPRAPGAPAVGLPGTAEHPRAGHRVVGAADTRSGYPLGYTEARDRRDAYTTPPFPLSSRVSGPGGAHAGRRSPRGHAAGTDTGAGGHADRPGTGNLCRAPDRGTHSNRQRPATTMTHPRQRSQPMTCTPRTLTCLVLAAASLTATTVTGVPAAQAAAAPPAVSASIGAEHLSAAGAWAPVLAAAPGERIRVLISYVNTAVVTERHVDAAIKLPKGAFLNGSVTLTNALHPAGQHLSPARLLSGGVNLGDYGPGANGFLTIYLRLPPKKMLPCGVIPLVLPLSVHTGSSHESATLHLHAHNTCPTAMTAVGAPGQ